MVCTFPIAILWVSLNPANFYRIEISFPLQKDVYRSESIRIHDYYNILTLTYIVVIFKIYAIISPTIPEIGISVSKYI